MPHPRERQPGRFEPQPFRNEFKVEAKGEESIYNWLHLLNEISQNPLYDIRPGGRNEITVELARLPLFSNLIAEVASAITFNMEESIYELRTVFITNGKVLGPIAVDLSDAASGRGENLAQALSKMIDISPPIDVSKIADELKKIVPKQYRTHYDYNRMRVVFDDPEGKIENFGALHPTGPAFCLHFKRPSDQDFDTFKKTYNEYAKLIPPVIQALFSAKSETVPPAVYTIAPPPDLDRENKRMEAQLSMQKKRMSLMGLDDGQELAEEVKERMILKEKPKETFDDIGGLEKAKEDLMEVVADLKDPSSAKAWGTDISRGTLLYGPPGTGKTLLAKATANAAEATIYVVNCADLIHHLYGKEQRLLNEVFNQARNNKQPSVIFFDEMDALFSHRDSFDHITSQNVSVLQTNLDGLIKGTNENLVVIGATNRLDAIDKSLLRPGRFNRLIAVNLPGPLARQKIFQIHMDLGEKKAERKLFNQVNFETLSSQTKSFSGDDIKELVRRALERKRREQRKGIHPMLVTTEDILKEIKEYEEIRVVKKKTQLGFGKETLEEKEEKEE